MRTEGGNAMLMGRCAKAFALAFLVSAPSVPQAFGHGAQTAPGHDDHVAGASDASTVVELFDLELIDADGKPVRFKTDVLADSIVVIDFVYTTCTTVCPILSTVMDLVRDGLGNRVGDEVRLVSISVDAGTDTPARLEAYSERFGARPGWFWLTGYKPDVDRVLDGLDAYTPDFADHPSLILVGDARRGGWTRFFGFPNPERILARVNELAAARD